MTARAYEPPAAARTALRVVLGVGVLLAIAIAVIRLPVTDIATRLAEGMRDTGATGILLFFAAYIISTVALLPGSLLTLAAGFAYGPGWGLLLASPASVAGATAAFVLGRTLLRDRAARTVRGYPKLRAIDAAVEREGFRLVLLLRLSPVFPFNVLNYGLSLSRVRLRTYVAASFLGMLPGTAFYAYLGSLASVAADLRTTAAGDGSLQLAMYVLGFAATLAVVLVATRLARRALSTELREADTSSG